MSRPFALIVQLALIVPAALFLLAVSTRGLGSLGGELAQIAQAIVTWYSARIWTLWVLLLALPICAFLIGGVALVGAHEPPTVTTRAMTGRIVAATTAAGAILAVVVLHMLAN